MIVVVYPLRLLMVNVAGPSAEIIETKFYNRGHCIIRPSDAVILTEFYELSSAGEPKAIERLSACITAMEVIDLPRDKISIIAKGVTTFENFLKVTSTLAGPPVALIALLFSDLL